jgi:proteasome assembly chaperone (PAC2) family protein
MKETTVVRIKEVALNNPILVEGLPGVGHVGKLVADHMVEELDAEKNNGDLLAPFSASGHGQSRRHHPAGPK